MKKYGGVGVSKILTSWRTLPLSRSRQIAHWAVPSSRAVVTQTCWPRTTGDDQPLSWMGVFQTTLVLSSQVVGRPVELERPVPLGPRNWAQLPSASRVTGKRRTREARRVRMNAVSTREFVQVADRPLCLGQE